MLSKVLHQVQGFKRNLMSSRMCAPTATTQQDDNPASSTQKRAPPDRQSPCDPLSATSSIKKQDHCGPGTTEYSTPRLTGARTTAVSSANQPTESAPHGKAISAPSTRLALHFAMASCVLSSNVEEAPPPPLDDERAELVAREAARLRRRRRRGAVGRRRHG